MSFSVTSKFIGNQKLLQRNVVSSSAISSKSWHDGFLFDSVTGGVDWIAAHVGTGTCAWDADCAVFLTTAALNDSAELLCGAAYNVGAAVVSITNVHGLNLKMGIYIDPTGDQADVLYEFGAQNAAGTDFIRLVNNGAGLVRLEWDNNTAVQNSPNIAFVDNTFYEVEFHLGAGAYAGTIELLFNGIVVYSTTTAINTPANLLFPVVRCLNSTVAATNYECGLFYAGMDLWYG